VNAIVLGVVRDGRVITDLPLPEGARGEVRLLTPPPEVTPDLQAEFEAWYRASDRALQRVEDRGPEDGADAPR
jgi:hypothetical protein